MTEETKQPTPTEEPQDDPPAEEQAEVEVDPLQKCTEERDEYLALLKQTQAEFQNYQKRIGREREQERQYYAAAVLREFLPVLDNLERAVNAAKEAGEEGSLVQGVTMVQSQFVEILKSQGVEVIDAEGQPFDASLHEALTQQPSPEHPTNTVMHVAVTGYKINERVLRPAQVVVSSGPPAES